LRMTSERYAVAAKVIATVDDLERIAASDQAPVAALRGWRRELFGEDALALKHGQLALAIENGRVVAVDRASGIGDQGSGRHEQDDKSVGSSPHRWWPDTGPPIPASPASITGSRPTRRASWRRRLNSRSPASGARSSWRRSTSRPRSTTIGVRGRMP